MNSNISIKVTDSDAGTRTQSFTITVSGGFTDIDEAYETYGIKVYPSPARSFVNIETGSLFNNTAKLQILTVSGILVSEYNVSGTVTRVDLSGINKGTYIFRITGDGKDIVGKFIKE